MVQATEIFMELIKRLMLIFTVQWHSENTAIPLGLPLELLNGIHQGTYQCQ